MATTPTRTRRLASGLAAAGLLLVPLSACSDEPVDDATTALDTAIETPAEEETSEPTMTEDSATETDAMATETGGAMATESGVECSGSSCVVTLSGDGTEVEVLGQTVTLGQVENGEATVGIAGQEVSCSEGETVSAGPLSLECTTVTPENVVMTATLG
ncbi:MULTISPECIES: hypothetical protein [unclassified Modestobacter]|uniref:hypothetical protein n=1 Tax=unclassified Modestobacter TaxID=2643866 RepID=UPI0022AA7576|nr:MULTISPECIES: hypothetical protein [unclassified Modestobacter]MCZ2827153.1 hypothetical protein [Modestobacter sp. VKM Ac-2981]MCZ2854404.1 hypothetical protein [Modestobacter sp. VKM Ac-2982]